ncbi:hypothetical protein FRC07_005968 [Ceratobasidium sp. 392]|nr:hypothetical protein FRC07_005968 [Ceratobasidium sp. 392]
MDQRQGKPQPPKALPVLAGVFRLIAAAYIVVLSVITLISALLHLSESVGIIIASVHILPASLVLLALELEVFREYATIRFPDFHDDMYSARGIALQFLAAILTGINHQRDFIQFIMGCVAFGITVGLVHLNGIHNLLWEVKTSFGNGGVAEKSPLRGTQNTAVGPVSPSVEGSKDGKQD